MKFYRVFFLKFCLSFFFVVKTQTLQALFGLIKIVEERLEQERRKRQATDNDIRTALEEEVESYKPGRQRV